jgi:RND family efflux transporter MFP subunit
VLWVCPVDGQNATKVAVQPVREAEVQTSVTLVGTAEARRSSTVASQVEGWVEEIFFEEGDEVQAGDPLARLEDRSLKIEIQGAVAALEEAKSRLEQSKADLERLNALWKTRSIAEKALQDAQFEMQARKERVNVLASQVENRKDELNKKTIRAPFSGWVAEQHVEVGEWVDAGGAVATLVDLDEVHIVVPVPERYIPFLKVGDSAMVGLDALPDRNFDGEIHSLLPRGDAQARTFPVEVAVPNSDILIRSGMLARVTFSAGTPHRGLLLPKDALVLAGSERVVFVVNGQKAHRVPVQVIAFHDNAVEVKADLRPGAIVVVIGNERLRDGQAVETVPVSSSDQNENPQ